MNKLAKQLFLTRQLDFGEEGSITLMGERSILVHASAFVNLHILANEHEECARGLYKAGKMTGAYLGNSLVKKGLAGDRLWAFICDVNKMSGWGNPKMLDLDIQKSRAVVQVDNCAIDYKTGTAKANCHFLRGMLAGSLKVVFGMEVDSLETKCTMRGDGLCEFVTNLPETFDLQSAPVREQLPVKELIQARKQKKLDVPVELENIYK